MVKEGQKRDSPDRDSGSAPDHSSIRNKERLTLYEFTLWGRDFVSVVRIRESRQYGGFFLKKIYENFVGTLVTVRNREEFVLERCPYREVRLYSFLPKIIT